MNISIELRNYQNVKPEPNIPAIFSNFTSQKGEITKINGESYKNIELENVSIEDQLEIDGEVINVKEFNEVIITLDKKVKYLKRNRLHKDLLGY